MKPVAGVFALRDDAERVAQNLRSIGISEDQITMLVPGENGKRVQSVPVNASEQPGMAKTLGAVVGAATGLAGGMELGVATSGAIGLSRLVSWAPRFWGWRGQKLDRH